MNQFEDFLSLEGNKEFIFYLENELLEGYNTNQKKFIYYLYNHYIFSVDYELDSNLIEVSSRTIDKIFKGKPYKEKIEKLIDDKIIETDNHYIVTEKCKSYGLNHEFFEKMIEKKDYSVKTLYSTKTCKRVFNVKSRLKTKRKDKFGRKHDPLILEAIEVMKGMVNFQSFKEFEAEIRSFYNNEHKYKLIEPGRYYNLCDLLKQIDSVKTYLNYQNFNEVEGTYDLYFKVSSNGRIFGNFQNKSRKIKKVLFEGFLNYDLSSSHPSILLSLLKKYGLPHQYFEEFVSDPEIKKRLMEESGLNEVIDIKKSFLPILYGGVNSSHFKSSFSKTIDSNMPFDIFDGDEAHKKWFIREKVKDINQALSPYMFEIKNWISFLKDEYIPSHTKTWKGEQYILNCLGRRIYLDQCESKNGNLIKRNMDGTLKPQVLHKVSSHIINGIESGFIFDITKITTELDGNTVIHNDFDGIVCTLPISKQSKRLASERSGYIEADSFVPKSIDPEFESFMKTGRNNLNK